MMATLALVVPSFIKERLLDKFRFLGNCPPTPHPSHHFAQSEKQGVDGQFFRNLNESRLLEEMMESRKVALTFASVDKILR